ncbi:MAG: hypothetical protein K0R14_705 [Burkholderiales bacterium]|jgi:hypothetical protein|nr:hypothetical protein [Burkholderiales bacterium]
MQKNIFKLLYLMFMLLWITPYSNAASGNIGSISVSGDPISSVWVNNYPQLADIQQKIPANNNKIPLSQKPLVGKVTNQFGLRDDILKNIVESVPNINASALYHAIRYAQYSQAMYLSNDKDEASQNMQDMMYAISCLSDSYGMTNTHNLILKTVEIRGDNQLRFTQQRKSEQLTAFKIFNLNNKAVNNDCHIGGKY